MEATGDAVEESLVDEAQPNQSAATTTAQATTVPKYGRRVRQGFESAEATAQKLPTANRPEPDVPAATSRHAAIAQETTGTKRWVEDLVTDVDTIPEMADVKEDITRPLVSSKPIFKAADSIQSLKELDKEIGSELNSTAEGIDLSLLTRLMLPPEMLEEPDVPWEMDLLLSQIASDAQVTKDLRKGLADEKLGKPGSARRLPNTD